MSRSLSRNLLGLFFIVAGANHFRSPQPYLNIMPDYLPVHKELVAISGLAEIAGGLGVLFPPTRRAAGWGLILLLLAVYPANIQAALYGMEVFGKAVPRWLLWARLPFQFVFLWWVYKACLEQKKRAAE
jgi:uncharacterized membrane protein